MPLRRMWGLGARTRAALALSALWLLFFGPVLFSDGVPFDRDLLQLYIPLRQFLNERLRHGELPQWFPYDGLGTPFIGQIVTATFHPETWLLLPFSAPVAVKLNLLLLYLGALVGGYKVARAIGTTRLGAVVGACAFAFGGYGVGVSNNLPYVLGWATLPWVFWAALRLMERERAKDAALLGLLLGSIFLGGSAQDFVLGAVLLLVALLVRGFSRPRVLLLGLACLIASLAMGAELIPALALAPDSSRSTVVGAESLGWNWALHPLRLLGFIIPSFTPALWRGRIGLELFNGPGFLWSSTVFAGGIALWLALLGAAQRPSTGSGRRSLVLSGFALLCVWLALGHRAGLLRLAWRVVPLLRSFRFPEKYLSAAWVALGPLVAIGFDRLRATRTRGLWFAAVAGVLCLAAAAFVGTQDVVGWLWSHSGHPLAPDDPIREALQLAWQQGLLTTGGLLLIAALLARQVRQQPRWAFALAGLVFAELWAGNGGWINLAPRSAFEEPNQFADLVRAAAPENGPPDHVFHFGVRLLDPNIGEGAQEVYVRDARLKMLPATDALDHVSGFGFVLPGSPARMFETIGTDPERFRHLAWAFNGCFAVTALDSPLSGDQVELARDESAALKLLRQPCTPHALLSETLPVADPAAATVAFAQATSAREAVWEGGPRETGHGGTIRWLAARPARLELEVDTPEPSGLVVNDTYARGWTATIDGVPTPIYPTNLAVRGIAVPAGRHHVTFSFQTPGLRLGLALSALGLLLALGSWRTSRAAAAAKGPPAATA